MKHNAPTKQEYDNLHVLMDVVDTVRHAQMDAERAAGEAMDDEALVSQVLGVYRSQGMAVDEATVREGLALMKARRFEFTAPKQSLATRLAGIYITRDQWGPKARGIAGAIAISIGIFVPSGMLYEAGKERKWMNQAEASIHTQAQMETTTHQLNEQIQPLLDGQSAVAAVALKAREELNEATQALDRMPELPESKRELERFYDRDKDQARRIVQRRTQDLARVASNVSEARAKLHDGRLIQTALQSAQVFDEPVPAHLDNLRTLQKLAFERGLAHGDAQGMHAAVGTLTQAVAMDARRDGMAGQLSATGGEAARALGASLEEARAALAVGNLAAAEALMDDVAGTLEILPLSYTLRIVSEPGEKTGVWRYFDGDRSRRSYYIVVDALDAAGNPVVLPIQSVEDNRITKTSRFAVRVPENVYNAVGEDKMDNGIVDRPTFGHKRAGQMAPSYEFETLGGTITTW